MTMALHEQSVGATGEWYTPRYISTALGCTFDVDVASPGQGVTPVGPGKGLHHQQQPAATLGWVRLDESEESIPRELARNGRMADDISLGRVWRELNDPSARSTPQTTVNALLYQLRVDGLGAFEHPNCRHRLAELSTEQLRELMAALIRTRPRFAPVTDELLIALDRIGRR
jgi:hypothetical protein